MRTTVMALLLFAPLLVLLAPAGGAEPARPEEQKSTIRHTFIGKAPDGTPVELFTLRKGEGITVKIMNYGGIVTELHAPDKAGKTADVVLGFDDLKGYVDGNHSANRTLQMIDTVRHDIISKYPKDFMLATTAAETPRAARCRCRLPSRSRCRRPPT